MPVSMFGASPETRHPKPATHSSHGRGSVSVRAVSVHAAGHLAASGRADAGLLVEASTLARRRGVRREGGENALDGLAATLHTGRLGLALAKNQVFKAGAAVKAMIFEDRHSFLF